jgi:hypothetical protein
VASEIKENKNDKAKIEKIFFSGFCVFLNRQHASSIQTKSKPASPISAKVPCNACKEGYSCVKL